MVLHQERPRLGLTVFRPIVAAAHRINASSFLLDGEAVIPREDGMPDFDALRSRRRDHETMLYAFDLIEHDGDDLRGVALIERKQRLGRLLVKAGDAIQFVEHLSHDGPDRVRPRLPHEFGGHRVESGPMRLIAVGRPKSGSRARTRRARRSGASGKRSGASLGRR